MEKNTTKDTGLHRWLFGLGKAQLVFCLTGLLLLLLGTGIAMATKDPGSLQKPLAYTALCLSSLVGGIAAVRFTEDGLLSGLLSGTLSLGLVRLLSLAPLPASAMEMIEFVCFLCLIPALSLCGAVVGKRRKKKHNPRHHRSMHS